MKRLVLTIVCTVSLFSALNSQFSLGLEGGANFFGISQTGNIPDAEPSGDTWFFAGVAPRYSFSSQLAILLDAAYSVKGYSLMDNPIVGDGISYRYSFLALSPQLEFRPAEFIGFGAGIFTGFRAKEELKFMADWTKVEMINLIKPVDFGLNISVRAYLNRFYIKVLYEIGLVNLSDVNYTDSSGEIFKVEERTRNLQVGVGYLIGFGS